MISVVVLAAGKGSRMKKDIPKVLVPVGGRPMLSYIVDAISHSGVCKKPIIVASPDNVNLLKNIVGADCNEFVLQDKQLGTGHALRCAESAIPSSSEYVLVLYGDHPFIQPETIRKLAHEAIRQDAVITMMTAMVLDFFDWRSIFFSWGRIIRESNDIVGIIEYKDANEEVRLITEVNPGLYCFKKSWLLSAIGFLNNQNSQNEYYLTDLIKIAIAQKFTINGIPVDIWQTIGVNTPEELQVAERILKKELIV